MTWTIWWFRRAEVAEDWGTPETAGILLHGSKMQMPGPRDLHTGRVWDLLQTGPNARHCKKSFRSFILTVQ